MLPLGSTHRRERPRPAIMVLMAITLLAVPIAIWDMVGGGAEGGDPAPVDVAQAATTSTTSTTSPNATDTNDEMAEVPAVTVALDVAWLAKGTSRYSDSDSDTVARINRNNSAATTSTTSPTSVVDGTSGGVDNQPKSSTPTKSVPQTTVAPPKKTAPQTTAAPAVTASPPTVPATTTAAPTTTEPAPPTTAPPTPATPGLGAATQTPVAG